MSAHVCSSTGVDLVSPLIVTLRDGKTHPKNSSFSDDFFHHTRGVSHCLDTEWISTSGVHPHPPPASLNHPHPPSRPRPVQVINAGAISDEGFISLPDYRPPQFARLLSWCMNFQIERNGGPREGPVELGSPHHLLPSRSPHTPLSLCRNFYSTYYILSAYLSIHSLERPMMHVFVCACVHLSHSSTLRVTGQNSCMRTKWSGQVAN